MPGSVCVTVSALVLCSGCGVLLLFSTSSSTTAPAVAASSGGGDIFIYAMLYAYLYAADSH